jgi:phosphoribosylamine--glycine ligase
MGACSPNFKLSIDDEYFIMNNVIYPTLDYFEISGNPYLGILGVNGILSDDGNIFILGWIPFLQDCDCAAILENINDDLYSLFESCIIGSFSDEVDNINISDKYSMSLVLNCNRRNLNENIIQGLDNLSDDIITTYYPTVKRNKYLELEAAYGQVLSLTSSASTLSKARSNIYTNIPDISFQGLHYRKNLCNVKY